MTKTRHTIGEGHSGMPVNVMLNIVLIVSSHMKLFWSAVKQSYDLLNR